MKRITSLSIVLILCFSFRAFSAELAGIGYSVNSGRRPLYKIDSGSGLTVHTLTFPFAPPGSSDLATFGLAYGDGHLWAVGYSVNSGRRPIYKLNPTTGAIVETITSQFSHNGIADLAPLSLAYGGGHLWALGYSVNSGPRSLYKINPANGSVVQTLTTPFRGSGSGDVALFGMAYGDGFLWAFGYSVNGGGRPLYKINPSNGNIAQTLTTSFSGGGSTDIAAFGLAYGGGQLWAFGNITSVYRPIKRINPATGALVQTITTEMDSSDVFPYGLAYIEPVSIAVQSNPTVGGSVTGAGVFNHGASVTVRATPKPCYTFVNWTVSGAAVSTASSYTFTASTNRILTANFSQLSYAITASSMPPSAGQVSGVGSVTCGSTVTVCATNNPGYSFLNWTENGAIVSPAPCYSFAVGSNRSLLANFIANPPPPPPALRLQKVGNKLLLSWSTNQPGFALESSSTLATWTVVNMPVATIGDSHTVSIPLAGNCGFFRLRK